MNSEKLNFLLVILSLKFLDYLKNKIIIFVNLTLFILNNLILPAKHRSTEYRSVNKSNKINEINPSSVSAELL